VLQKTGGAAGRSGIKRKADEPTVDREILLVEDLTYTFNKWDAARDEAAKQQPEPVKKTRGCVDTRFQYSAEALANTVGMTAVLQRLYKLWRAVCEAEGLLFAAELSRENLACQLELAQVSKAKAVEMVSKDPWHTSKFDFSAAPRRLVFNDFLNSYSGRLILPQLDVLSHRLNPTGIDAKRLQAAADDAGSEDEGADDEGEGGEDGGEPEGGDACALTLPKDCPVQALTLQKLPSLLLDLGDLRLRVSCCVSDVVGNLFFMPHLNFVEMRRPGIFFEAHDGIEEHRGVLALFDDDAIDFDAIDGALRDQGHYTFARGLRMVLRYAALHDLQDFAEENITAKMASYSTYYHDQTEEYFSNPALIFGRLGSKKSGVAAAKWLVAEGKAELIAALADALHADSPTVREELNKESYDGPLTPLVDEEEWQQLMVFANQEQPLASCRGAEQLHERIFTHYTPLRIANVWGEELVKDFKHLSAQVRAHPRGAEIRLRTKRRKYPGYFASPTLARVKLIRKKLGHHLPKRSRPAHQPPLAEEEVEELVWPGREEEEEEGLSSEEEEDGEESEVDGSEGEDEVEGEDQDDEGEQEADETDEAVLQQMREQSHAIEPRERLATDRGFLCWETAQRTAFFPLILTENWAKGMRKIKCACLQPRGDGIYTIDPRWKGESDKGADKATIALIFEVMGEGLRQLPDGFKGERAWKLTLVRRQ
jgi:hypothetical protein